MTAIAHNSIAEGLLVRLPHDPAVHVQNLDLLRERVLLLQFDERALRAASFLDDRILAPGIQGAWCHLEAILRTPIDAAALRPLHYIFHTGHVGSTLLSRLLDEVSGVLSLREPLPLRTLADAHDALTKPEALLSPAVYAALLARFCALWARGTASTRCVVLKATSTAGRMAVPLLQHVPAARGVYLNLAAEPYLATLLAGDNSLLDLRGMAVGRMRRLSARGLQGLRALHECSAGELAALSWLVETWSQHDAVQRFPERMLPLDFERVLGAIGQHMGTVLRHFGLEFDDALLERLQHSDVLKKYSKAPEHAYSLQVRRDTLHDSRQRNATEIRRGLRWLDDLGQREPAVAAVLTFAPTCA